MSRNFVAKSPALSSGAVILSGLQAAKLSERAPVSQLAKKLAHACSTVEERPFRAAKAVQ
jgi:hypothetical protein